MSTINILHLESANSDPEKMKELLETCEFKYSYKRNSKIDMLEDELATFNPAIVIADYDLFSIDPKKISSVINNHSVSIPLILTADKYSREISIQMVNSGAADFIFKDRFERLPLIIKKVADTIRLEKNARENQEKVIGREKKFQTLLENISDAIMLIDERGTILYQSPSSKRISGFSSTETIRSSIFKFIYPSDVILVTRCLKKAIKQPAGVSIQNSFRMKLKNGLHVWIEGTFTNALHDTNIKAVIVSYRDVTQRRISEDLLQKQEANLRTIFDNTNVSYVLSNAKFKLLSFNSAAIATYAKEFKVQLREGDRLLDYLPETRKAESRKRFERALKGEKVNYELSFIQEDGSTTWYNVNMFAIKDGSEKLLGFIISSENITTRKQIEFERNKMFNDLVRHNKDLEQFAYIISHNLKSPVANIIGLSALIEDSDHMDRETLGRCVKGLSLSVKKLDEVIADLNSILQTRRDINEKKELVNFSELTDNVKTSISSQIDNQNITIDTCFTVSGFYTIKSYIYSIFFNLISNSIKYRDSLRPLNIKIKSEKINNKLTLEFKDNGMGLDLDIYGDSIFGLYKKFHYHVEGKGIGLYMVKSQIEMLDGTISVASKVNTGTTFTIEFEEQVPPL